MCFNDIDCWRVKRGMRRNKAIRVKFSSVVRAENNISVIENNKYRARLRSIKINTIDNEDGVADEDADADGDTDGNASGDGVDDGSDDRCGYGEGE